MDTTRIQIALASDGNYFVGLLVTAVSLARAAAADCDLVFNVLSGGIAPARLDELRRHLVAAHPRSDVRVFEINQTNFAAFPEWHGAGRMTYARIMLPELLPEEDFVLYCDVDFLWTADVAELWALRDPHLVLQGCRDDHRPSLELEAQWYAARGLKVDMSRYLNGGLLLMNLRRFRDEGLSRQLMDFLHRHPDVGFVDQTAINAVVADTGILPPKWNRYARAIRAGELPGRWAIHFAGLCPWKPGHPMQFITDAHLLWYGFYGELTGQRAGAAWRQFFSLRQYVLRRLPWKIAARPWRLRLLDVLLRHTRYRYAARELALLTGFTDAACASDPPPGQSRRRP